MVAGMKFADYKAQYPDHELIVYRNTAVPIEGWPNGFTCLIAVPKAKIAEVMDKGGKEPFWRHGDVMEVTTRKPDVEA